EESENGVEKHRAAPRPSIAGPSAGASKLLPETSARGNVNLSGGAGLQTRRASASFTPKTRANAPLSAQVLELHRRQNPLRPPGRPLHPVDGRRDRRGAPPGRHVVYAQVISHQDLEQATTALTRRYEQLLRGRADLLRGLNLSGQALDQLIQQALLRHEAARLGIAVANAEIDETVKRMPDLQQNGRFDRSLLEAYLRGERVPGAFEDEVRQDILRQRLQALVTDGVGVSDGELEERYRFDHEKANLAFVRNAAADLAATITLSDE